MRLHLHQKPSQLLELRHKLHWPHSSSNGFWLLPKTPGSKYCPQFLQRFTTTCHRTPKNIVKFVHTSAVCQGNSIHAYHHVYGIWQEKVSFITMSLVDFIKSVDSKKKNSTRGASPVMLLVKILSANAGDVGSTPGSGRSPGEGNSNPLQYSYWKIPWTEEPGGLQSMGSQRAEYNWSNLAPISMWRAHCLTSKKKLEKIANVDVSYQVLP